MNRVREFNGQAAIAEAIRRTFLQENIRLSPSSNDDIIRIVTEIIVDALNANQRVNLNNRNDNEISMNESIGNPQLESTRCSDEELSENEHFITCNESQSTNESNQNNDLPIQNSTLQVLHRHNDALSSTNSSYSNRLEEIFDDLKNTIDNALAHENQNQLNARVMNQRVRRQNIVSRLYNSLRNQLSDFIYSSRILAETIYSVTLRIIDYLIFPGNYIYLRY